MNIKCHLYFKVKTNTTNHQSTVSTNSVFYEIPSTFFNGDTYKQYARQKYEKNKRVKILRLIHMFGFCLISKHLPKRKCADTSRQAILNIIMNYV